MASGGGKSILEMWLGDTPNSNHSSVKKERKDLNDLFNPPSSTTVSAPSTPPSLISLSSFCNNIYNYNQTTAPTTTATTSTVIATTSTTNSFGSSGSLHTATRTVNNPSSSFYFPDTSAAFPSSSNFGNNSHQSQALSNSQQLQSQHASSLHQQQSYGGQYRCTTSNSLSKVAQSSTDKTVDDPIDAASLRGWFGWARCKEVVLPYILRKSDKLVPVRIVESKIIGRYSNYLPWKVFSCINIRSYYITEIEAKLLNEINSYHSEFYFGTELFTCKDVVVCLSDVGILHKFLETSRSVFENGLDSCAFLGFIEITNPKSVLPYIAKEVNLTDEELAKQDQQKIHQNSKDEIQLDQIFPDLFGGMSESKNADEDNHEPDAQTRSASNGHNHNDDDQDQLDRPLTIESNDKVTSPALESANPVIEAASSTQAQKSNGNTDRPRPNKCPELSSLLADDDVIVCSAEVQKRKCVPRSLIEGHNIDDDRIESLQMTEWDASYLKMICIYAGFDQLISLMGKVVVNNSTGGTAKPSDDLCRLDSLYSQSDQQPVEFTEHQIAHVNANLAMPINSNQSEINNRYACVQQNLGATNSATVYANSLNRMQPSVSSFATSKAPTVVAPLTNAASIQNPIPPQLQNSILQPHHHLPTNPLLMNTNRVYKTQTSQQQPPRPVAYVSSSRVRPLPPPPLGSTGSFGQQGVYNQVYQTQDQLASSSTSLNNAQISNRQISPAQPTPNHLHHRSNSSSSLIRSSGSQAAVVPKNQRQLYDNGLGATLTNQNRPVMPLVSPAIAQSTTNGLAPRSMSLSHRTSTHNSISNNTATSNNNQNSNTNLGHEIDLFNHLCALLPENLSGLNNHNLSQQQQQQPQSQGQQLNSLRNQSIVSNNVSNSVTPNDNNNMNWLNNFLNNGAAFRSVNSSSTTTTNSSSNSNRTQPVAQIDANQLLSDLLTRTNGLVTQQMQQNPQAAALTAQRNAYNAGQSLASNLSRWNGMASTSNPNISTASTAPALNHHLSSQPNDATQSLHQSNSSGAVVRSDSTDATHRIYRVEVGGCTLRAINLFPDSSLLVVLVGEIAQKILTGVTYFNLTKILVNVFEFQLFDISKDHEATFIRSGYKPIARDKLVRVDLLRVSLPILKHYILTQGTAQNNTQYNQTSVN